MKLAVVGAGWAGLAAAVQATQAGHTVTVYNRSTAKAQAWMAECPGQASAHTPREAAAGADIVFACVGNDDDLRSVVLGPDGAFAAWTEGIDDSAAAGRDSLSGQRSDSTGHHISAADTSSISRPVSIT